MINLVMLSSSNFVLDAQKRCVFQYVFVYRMAAILDFLVKMMS